MKDSFLILNCLLFLARKNFYNSLLLFSSMNKKQLALFLSKLSSFSSFSSSLEQYVLSSELAADILWTAFLQGDIEDKIVADLGCGPGILGIGALLLGAKKVFFVDIDSPALNDCRKNLKNVHGDYEIICSDVSSFSCPVDTVLMNPPFGVQVEHADRAFLERAFSLSSSVYSLHTIESETFLRRFSSEFGFSLVSVRALDFPLKKTYSFHTKRIHFVSAGLFYFRKA